MCDSGRRIPRRIKNPINPYPIDCANPAAALTGYRTYHQPKRQSVPNGVIAQAAFYTADDIWKAPPGVHFALRGEAACRMTQSAEKSGSSQLADAYREFDHDLRVHHSKVGYLLTLTLVPACISLDWFVYPQLLGPLFKSRLICDGLALPCFLLLFTPFGRRHMLVLGNAWLALPMLTICWMIYASEGAMSSYYAGLNLVLLAACLVMPYTFFEAIGFSGFTIFSYAIACTMHRAYPPATALSLSADPSRIAGTMFNNFCFLAATSVVCATASRFSSSRRFEDFRLRHELDVSNRHLNQSYEQLAEMDRLKSAFFANISHELRTPLTLIISPIEEILHAAAALPGKTREALSTARSNALRLLKLISDLLDIVRLEEGRAELRREPIDLSVFVPAMADSMRHLATVKGLKLQVQADGQQLIVQGDSSGLEKVVLNILTNAIKFTPKDGSITVRLGREDNLAVVEIEDTGIGIPQQSLPHIFDRFHQVDGSTTRKYQGVGIGLALARDLAQQHGGRLTARSQLGKGTTFRIELPIDASRSVAFAAPAPKSAETVDPIADIYRAANRSVSMPAEAAAPAEVVGTGNHLVLVVDDESDMRRFLVDALKKDNKVVQAADGLAGLELVRAKKPDLVVLDLMLPGMDGLDVCKQVKSDPATKNTKIVLLTARVDEQSKLTALERGADDFLTKPFSTLELQTRLANLLRSADLEEQIRLRNRELETTIKKLQDTEVQLVQSEKMNALGKLSAGLLHEINNPLNFTFMALQMAEQEAEGNASLQDTLKDIGQGMSRVRGVISDLRTFAYPTSASAREDFDIEEALTTALRLTAHELTGVNVDQSRLNHTRVSAGKTQVIHLLMNLLVNSAQAMSKVKDQREPRIVLKCEQNGQRVEISLTDNGTGVKKEHLPRLFEPFFTTKDVGQGMGLGLSICHTIVKNHGGEISIQSEEGQWTTVTFDLPSASVASFKTATNGETASPAFKDVDEDVPGSIAA
jgi:signal transduction histidine kinase